MWASNKVTLFLKVLLYKPQSHRSGRKHRSSWRVVILLGKLLLEEVSPGWLVKLECVQRPAAVVCGDGW